MTRIREFFFDTRDKGPRFFCAKDWRKCGDEPRVDYTMLAADFIEGNKVIFSHTTNCNGYFAIHLK
jgi:hypothetical protein